MVVKMENEKCKGHIIITHTNLYENEYQDIYCILPKGHSHSHLGIDGYNIYWW